MRFGIVVFPGSNCDTDCFHAVKDVCRQDAEYIWHKDKAGDGFGCIMLPGGFSYGDYLRCGAIARFSPVMESVVEYAKKGGLVLGICNGFQIALESGLLPGAMRRNNSLEFRCEFVNIRVENNKTPFTNRYEVGDILKVPIAHGEGNYYIDENDLQDLISNDRIVFRYCNDNGEPTQESNPNGAVYNIAGICNEEFNVLGMMPHPERASELVLGSKDGKGVFDSIANK